MRICVEERRTVSVCGGDIGALVWNRTGETTDESGDYGTSEFQLQSCKFASDVFSRASTEKLSDGRMFIVMATPL